MDKNEFQYFHTYERMAEAGIVPPLVDSRGHEYVTLSENGELVLYCPFEDLITTPGAAIYHKVYSAVDSYGEKYGN